MKNPLLFFHKQYYRLTVQNAYNYHISHVLCVVLSLDDTFNSFIS